MTEFEEKICRYCFENEENGELISPCNCIGGLSLLFSSYFNILILIFLFRTEMGSFRLFKKMAGKINN